MEVKTFYCCHLSDDEVPSSDPVVLDLDTAVDVALQVLRIPGDFIGFVDSSDRVLQFRFEESEQVWVEHPSPKDGGSFGTSHTSQTRQETRPRMELLRVYL